MSNINFDLMYNYDEETVEHVENEGATVDRTESGLLARLETRMMKLNKEESNLVKRQRVIDRQFMEDAPKDFFQPYLAPLIEAKGFFQKSIADKHLEEHTYKIPKVIHDDEELEKIYNVISTVISDAVTNAGFTGMRRSVFNNLMINEIMGLSMIDPLYRDRAVTEIYLNGPYEVQIQTAGKLRYVHSCRFLNVSHVYELFDRIFGPLNKRVSVTTPQVKGRLSDLSRVFANDVSLCPLGGPLMNLRRHQEKYVPPKQLIEWGAATPEVLTELGNLINAGASYIVTGGTGSGKTTALSSFTGFIPNDLSILTLEDNLEMKACPHKMLRPGLECRAPNIEDKNSHGVSMRDLVKGSLQMKPDWIIVGEVTDGACYDMIQALSTGHYGGSTVHTESAEAAIGRMVALLSQGGVITGTSEALPLIGAAVDLIVVVERFPLDGSRKITQIVEVPSLPKRDEFGELKMELNELWRFVDDGYNEEGKVLGHWEKTGEISDALKHKLHLSLAKNYTWEELQQLAEGEEVR